VVGRLRGSNQPPGALNQVRRLVRQACGNPGSLSHHFALYAAPCLDLLSDSVVVHFLGWSAKPHRGRAIPPGWPERAVSPGAIRGPLRVGRR
jgi:hypothetical protein